MTKNKKQHSPRENASNMSTKEVKQVKETKLKYLFGKDNEYGTNHFHQVLDESPLNELIELGKTMEFPICEYNGKFYLKINAAKRKEAQVENGVKKNVPYIMDLSFTKYDFEKDKEQIIGYSISEINKIY